MTVVPAQGCLTRAQGIQHLFLRVCTLVALRDGSTSLITTTVVYAGAHTSLPENWERDFLGRVLRPQGLLLP